MGMYTLLGCSVVVGLALLSDPVQTVRLGVYIITARGATFLSKRIVHTMNKDYGDIIDFAGWCIAGLYIVPIIKLSTSGFTTVADSMEKAGNSIKAVLGWIENLGGFIK
jgi:hypothetical protein